MSTPNVPGFKIIAQAPPGMTGSTYQAVREADNATLALKIFKPAWSGNKWFVDRLKQEAERVRAVKHDHISRLLQIGEGFVVSEWSAGTSVAALIKQRGTIDESLAVQITRQTAVALDAIARVGLTHGEVKPSNILVDGKGKVKLTDMVVARSKGLFGPSPTSLPLPFPYSIAPERLRASRERDIREDLYALGVVLFEMLTGHVPYTGGSPNDILQRAVAGAAPGPRRSNPDVNPELDAIAKMLLHRDPNQRYQTPSELIEDLDSLMKQGEAVHAAPPPVVPEKRYTRSRDAVQAGGSGKTLLFLGAAAVLVGVGVYFVVTKFGSEAEPYVPVAERKTVKKPAGKTEEVPEEAPVEKGPSAEQRKKTLSDIHALLDAKRFSEAGAMIELHRDEIDPALIKEFEGKIEIGKAEKALALLDAEISELLTQGKIDAAIARVKGTSDRRNQYLRDGLDDKIDELDGLRRRRARGETEAPDVEAQLVRNAEQLLKSGNPDQAFQDLAKLVFLNPNNDDAKFLLIRCQIARGKTKGLSADLDTILSRNPNHAEAAKLRLEIARKEKDHAKVVELLRKPIADNARDVNLRMERANAYMALSQSDKALRDVEAVLSIDAEHDDARRLKLQLLLAKGERTKVLDLLTIEIRKNPDDVDPRFERALAYIELGEFKKAKEDLKKILDLRPGHREATGKLVEVNKRLEGPMRKHEFTPTMVALFDGKSALGWIPNEEVRLGTAGKTLSVRTSDRDNIIIQQHDMEFAGDYVLYAGLRAGSNFRGRTRDGLKSFIGLALGFGHRKNFYLLHLSGNHAQVDLCTGHAGRRRPVVETQLKEIPVGTWMELRIEVKGGEIEVKNKETVIIPKTKLSGGDTRGTIAVVLNGQGEAKFRWLDVDGPKATSGPVEARSGLHFTRKNRKWKVKGKWEFVDEIASARPAPKGSNNLGTIRHKAPKTGTFELDVDLVANIGGAGYGLIFFQAYGKSCALGVGRDNKRREVLAIGQMGSVAGRDVFYNNNNHFVAKPGGVTFGTKNRYRVIVLDASVEVYIGDSRVFSETRSEFLSKLEFAMDEMKKWFKKRGGFSPRDYDVGFGAWDASAKDNMSVQADFYDFQLKPIE